MTSVLKRKHLHCKITGTTLFFTWKNCFNSYVLLHIFHILESIGNAILKFCKWNLLIYLHMVFSFWFLFYSHFKMFSPPRWQHTKVILFRKTAFKLSWWFKKLICNYLLFSVNVCWIKFKKVKMQWSELNVIEQTVIYNIDENGN